MAEKKEKAKKKERSAIADFKKKLTEKAKQSKKWRIGLLVAWAFLMMLWVWIAVIPVQYLCAFLIANMHLQVSSTVLQAIFTGVVYAVSLVVTILVPWKVLGMKTTRNEIGLSGLLTWTDLLLAPVAFIVFMIFSTFLLMAAKALLPGVDWEQTQNVGFSGIYSLVDYLLAFACLVILAPICEEIIFRGWLYGKMRSRMSAAPAILLVSLLFGIVHMQLNVGLIVFAMSIAMCILRELTGTIHSGIVLHMIKNGLAFYALFVNPGFGVATAVTLLLA